MPIKYLLSCSITEKAQTRSLFISRKLRDCGIGNRKQFHMMKNTIYGSGEKKNHKNQISFN